MMFSLPPETGTADNSTRKVGFEIEYSGVEFETSARVLAEVLDGNVRQDTPFCLTVESGKYGTFRLEIDAAFLKDEKYLDYLDKLGIDIHKLDAKKSLGELLREVASTVVPCEIVMPPIPMDRLDIADEIVRALRRHRAKGTRASFLYAFGLHINTEVASTDCQYLLNHIRAFIILFDWICEKSGVDLSRRITPYISKYPGDYIRKVLHPEYKPDINQLIDDYLHFNPSRNHALDMLPLFAVINEPKVMRKAREPELINARPAFHYRLANSLIDEDNWTISKEWQYWVAIERLAADTEKLKSLGMQYLEIMHSNLPTFTSRWLETLQKQLDQ